MGTISTRKRKDGTPSYTAQILRKKGGVILHREARTFDKKREAESWIRWREAELDKPGGIEQAGRGSATLGDAVDRYLAEHPTIGRTKQQCLRTIKAFPIAAKECSTIKATDISAFAKELLDGGRKPQTCGNYLSHLAAVFNVAKPLWGMQLDTAAMKEAQAALGRIGGIAKSDKRERRPSCRSSTVSCNFSQIDR